MGISRHLPLHSCRIVKTLYPSAALAAMTTSAA